MMQVGFLVFTTFSRHEFEAIGYVGEGYRAALPVGLNVVVASFCLEA